jgi:uncharacterized protein (TIGR03066 family)
MKMGFVSHPNDVQAAEHFRLILERHFRREDSDARRALAFFFLPGTFASKEWNILFHGEMLEEVSKNKGVDKAKLVGTWELVKTDAKDAPPPGTLVEFTKDGKLKVTVEVGEKKVTLNGTCSVDGDKLKTKMTTPDGQEHSDTDTITKVTDKQLLLKGGKGENSEFKKK